MQKTNDIYLLLIGINIISLFIIVRNKLFLITFHINYFKLLCEKTFKYYLFLIAIDTYFYVL